MPIQEHVVSRRKVARALGITILALLLLDIAVNVLRAVTGRGHIFGIVPMFDLAEEMNIPTLFSTLLLVATAVLLHQIHVANKSLPHAASRHWAVLSFIFLYLAIDEFTELHEKLSRPMQKLTGILPGSFEYWGWVIPYAVLVVIAAAYFLPFFLKLPRRFQLFFAASAAMYIGGAMGCEVLEGLYLTVTHKNPGTASADVPFVILVALEELLEMSGAALFFCSLLEYLEGISGEHVFRLKS